MLESFKHYNIKNVGEEVTLTGWVSKVRNLGGLVFIDLRNRTGIMQVVVRPECSSYEVASNLKSEYVIAAISGGPDSMCLLDVLKNHASKFKIVVAHVHHNLRDESDEEALNLEKYCIASHQLDQQYHPRLKQDQNHATLLKLVRYSQFGCPDTADVLI